MLVISSFSSQAATGARIVCQTAFGEKTLAIENEHISFLKEDETGIQRSISSIGAVAVRTQKKHLGFTKTLYLDGHKHRINLQNTNEFSDVNDYLSITSPKGHEMTYPLNCHST